jgi:iron(III) transport system ATP-binding protein
MALPAHQRAIGFVFQDGALFPHLSVAENIGFGLKCEGAARDASINELMDMVALAPIYSRRRPHELSGGQQQRVALARALALKPRLMLLDEPFSALDTGLRAATRKAVGDLLSNAGITTILVTHDQAEALSFADQVAVLRDGRAVQVGAPDDLYWHPVDRGAAELLGDCIILPATISNGAAHCAIGSIGLVPGAGAQGGRADIMVRPEQITLAPAIEGAGVNGKILALEFSGHSTLVTVRLAGQGEAGTCIVTLRAPSGRGLAKGAHVGIVVNGTAHILG